MGINSALRSRIKQSKKNTKIGNLLKKKTKVLRRKVRMKY